MACDRTQLWLGLLGFGLRILYTINILESTSFNHHGWHLFSWVFYKELITTPFLWIYLNSCILTNFLKHCVLFGMSCGGQSSEITNCKETMAVHLRF